ncbi:ribonuclease Z [Oceanisphaera arctica]|uniref:Ribonuclease Z n=1 Tax=Oceanisphaera arctica TaxID=641510 RepID=A0A2P5TJA5_9GAMM|nr:ribonuclease Z [Oceanisphaera arctica]PPL14936.1 MBL fold metallo-hydrolase [Oceanisphaera arctica]GHA22729.1 ribonuclease Z [Oceanisphaera arctica]
MELIFLGTSSGSPTKSRNVSGLALRKAGAKPWILVDCGEGTQHRLLHTSLSLNRLQAICITHVHGDHCYGLPGLLASAAMSRRSAPLTIIGPAALQDWVNATQEATHLTLCYPLHFIDVATLTERQERVAVEGFNISALPLSHRVPSFGYEFVETGQPQKLDVEKLKADKIEPGPLWGRLQRGERVTLANGGVIDGRDYLLALRAPRKIIICGDNDNPALLAERVGSANVLVHEATFTRVIANKLGAGPQHSSAMSIAQFAAQASVANLILTHFSPRYKDGGPGISIRDIEQEARAHYGGNLFLARDLEVFHLDRAGELSRTEHGPPPSRG